LSAAPPNEALKDLASLLGDEATREIVHLFLEDFPESIRSMSSCDSSNQLRLAHGLRSSALHMGAESLTRRMALIEDRLNQSGELARPDELAGAMADFEAFAVDLRHYADG
jgi:HPt (histidine-containing phosphotransfer) domain-containing protein